MTKSDFQMPPSGFSAHIKLLLALLLLLFAGSSRFAFAVSLNAVTDSTAYPSAIRFDVYEDPDRSQTFESIDDVESDQWTTMTAAEASFGFTKSFFWLRTAITNETDEVTNFLAELDYVLLDDVVIQAKMPNGQLVSLTLGDTHSFYPRHIDHPSNLFEFQLAPEEQVHLTIRVGTEGSMLLPLALWEEQAFFESSEIQNRLHFFYFGAISVIILINIAVFLNLRERLYLYYSVAIAGYFLFFATSRGYVHQLFLPNLPDLNSRLFLVSMPFLALFSLLFARHFLKTRENSPRLDLAIKAMIGFELFNLTLAIIGNYDTVVRVSSIGAILLFSVLFFAGPITWFKRRRAGTYFTIAWAPLTVGVFVTAGRSAGFLPNTFWTEYAMQIGSGLEALILTLALADRLYREREKKIRAQAESIRIEQQRNLTQSLLAQTMSRDPITHLSNRNRFELHVRNTIKANPQKKFFVAVAHVSRMEEVSRTLGLSSADRVLKMIAHLLDREVVEMDGVVTDTNEQGELEGAFQLARETFGVFAEQEAFEREPSKWYGLLQRVAEPVELEGLSIDLGVIYGSALYPQHAQDPAQLIRNSLIALKASRSSKGNMGIFDHHLDVYDTERLSLVTQLREAIETGSLELYYQPKVDIRSQNVVGMEGLARWNHPTRGFIPPDEFIPLAEEAGLINRLTLWAFEQAITDLEQLRESGFTGSVAVNISARDLLMKDLSEKFKEILDRHQVTADNIYLELTETGAMEDPEAGIAALNELARLGLKIAIDDFGSGYSSLSYLQRLPASEIKLDRALIHDVCSSDSTAVIVKTSIDMVHALGYALVAEGVEDEQTVKALSDFHCDCFQGFWCCKPLPLPEVMEWLQGYSAAS